jgi:hypothetical protein
LTSDPNSQKEKAPPHSKPGSFPDNPETSASIIPSQSKNITGHKKIPSVRNARENRCKIAIVAILCVAIFIDIRGLSIQKEDIDCIGEQRKIL